jgi:hypothetical protein
MAKKSSKPLSPFNKFLGTWLLPWSFTLTGLTIMYLGSQNLFEAHASAKWPTTEGVIISSKVDRERRSGKHHRTTNYSANIEYEFKYKENIYNGNRTAIGEYGSGNSSHADEIVGSFPKGLKVLVYFNPNNPSESVLDPGIKGKTWLLFGAGFVFFAFGCGVMVMFSIYPMK